MATVSEVLRSVSPDFVVLGSDIMTVPAKEIESMKALATYIGGKQVYRDPGFNP